MRGTTPTHIFSLPFHTDVIKSVRIIYSQNGVPVFVKETEQCNLQNNEISVVLSQEDTLLLENYKPVEIQLRVLSTDGKAIASGMIYRSAGVLLEDEVIV